MHEVVPFDAAESQRLLARRDAVITTLADVGITADEQTAAAVLVAVEEGVEVADATGRPAGTRPAETADIAAVLDGFGVAPTPDTALHTAAAAVETSLGEETA